MNREEEERQERLDRDKEQRTIEKEAAQEAEEELIAELELDAKEKVQRNLDKIFMAEAKF